MCLKYDILFHSVLLSFSCCGYKAAIRRPYDGHEIRSRVIKFKILIPTYGKNVDGAERDSWTELDEKVIWDDER